jgi:hypothetical protein
MILHVFMLLCRRKQKRRKSPYRDQSDERTSIATGYDPFNGGYNKPPSMTGGPRMMLPSQNAAMFENPTYTLGGQSEPLFY